MTKNVFAIHAPCLEILTN